MGHGNSRTGNFIGQCQLEKKCSTVRTGITCTSNRNPGNGIMERYTTQVSDGRVELLKGKISVLVVVGDIVMVWSMAVAGIPPVHIHWACRDVVIEEIGSMPKARIP